MKTPSLLLGLLLGSLPPYSLHAEVADNPQYIRDYQNWNAALVGLLPTAFLPGPVGAVADLATIGIDIHLKHLPASFVAPTPSPVSPNSPDGCHYRFHLPRREGEYQNLLGLFDTGPLPTDWGSLGTPTVGHHNSEVTVRVDSPHLQGWSSANPTVSFPSGQHPLDWRAETQLDVLFDVIIPSALFVITAELKYGKAITSTDPGSAARALAIGKEFLKNAALEAGVITAGALTSAAPVTTASHAQSRNFSVYDINPPTIQTSDPTPAPFEALDFGGLRWDRVADALRATISVGDPCGVAPQLSHDAPFLLPIGATTVVWSATDSGPLPPDDSNPGVATVVQTVVVEDTLAPILLAPPSRVIESSVAASLADVQVGSAVVFDLADPNPLLENNLPTSFPVDSRTEIAWTATDSAGNSDQKSQWVTVKTPGSNTPPSVTDVSAETLTGEPVDIQLTGSDGDFLSGRFDPLSFKIVSPPSNGFFIAPLVPYFIEDFRVRPGDEVGNILNTSNNPAGDLGDVFCRQSREIPRDFVYQPEFVLVSDDSIQFVLDRYWDCQVDDAVTQARISKWSPDGQLLGQSDMADSVKRITLDRDGFLYTVIPGTASEALFLNRLDQDFNLIQNWKLDASTPYGSPPNRMLHARLDSDTGIIYATDKSRVYAYDGNDGQFIPGYLGVLKGGERFLSGAPSVAGSSSRGFYIEVDSQGFLYVVDSGLDRIHRFAPATLAAGVLTPGEHVGWLGRCDSGPNCDDEQQRSIGYSCTDATCQVVEANGNNCGAFISGPCSWGSRPGQFHTPIGIALDPEDMLYVTDYDNFRVQRFSPLGDFAGEAGSTCDGNCFVLGDMGRPLDISVNAQQFFVLDRDRDLMHVFETAPFQEITENSVTLSYASDNHFQGMDSFSFRANDGLVDSNPGTANVSVSRNFRPPVAREGSHTLAEDSTHPFTLEASDPDGILGVDFNGLDTLSFQVIEVPLHGQLSGTAPALSYTPDADFHGEDQLRFTVSDGRFSSAPATVVFTVTPVNDAPQVRLTDADAKLMPRGLWRLLEKSIIGEGRTVGLGFPVPLLAEFEDPDTGQTQSLLIDWGDGGDPDSAGQAPPDPDTEYDQPVITPTFQGLGQIVAEHTYTSAGPRTVEVCVIDAPGLDGCARANILVAPMVDLGIQDLSDRSQLPLPGEETTLEVEVINNQPVDGVDGLSANNVIFTATLPPGVILLEASTPQGSCNHVPPTTTCGLGNLAPGAAVVIHLRVLPEPGFDAGELGYSLDVTADEADASGDNLTTLALPTQEIKILVDGFELP